MAGATARIPATRYGFSGESGSQVMFFGFFEDGGEGSPQWGSSGSEGSEQNSEEWSRLREEEEEEDEERENSSSSEQNKAFWENQHQLLQGTLYRTSSLESKIRNATKEALKQLNSAEAVCDCRRKTAAASTTGGGCRKCLMREVCGRLRDSGFNCAICKTKWRSSPEIPSGEHTFLDVVDNSNPKKGEVRVIIELTFRAEFEMARASEEYSGLIGRLPEVFVGKVERLQGLIKVLCSSAKKCMKQNKMHMGPWRKQRYVRAKWLSPNFHRTTPTRPYLSSPPSSSSSSITDYDSSERLQTKPKASMLTVNLLERVPNLFSPAVEVV